MLYVQSPTWMKANIFLNSISLSLVDTQTIAGKSKVIEVVLGVIRTHINNASVCRSGCNVLFSSIDENGKPKFTEQA